MTDQTRIDPQAALARIDALTDAEDTVHAVVDAGQSEFHSYYLVVVERSYDGNRYLNERYVQLVTDEAGDDYEDTYKTNGINRRVPEGETALSFMQSLAAAYGVTADREQAVLDGRLGADAPGVVWRAVSDDGVGTTELVTRPGE